MSLMAAPPDVLRWSPRSQGHGDCAVAALEIACGVSYEQALSASLNIRADVLTQGLSWQQIRKAAKLMGFSSKLLKVYDLDEDTGILDVKQPHVKDSDHAVYLWEGRIIEPKHDRQQLWLHANDFLSHYHYKAGSLLVLKREE